MSVSSVGDLTVLELYDIKIPNYSHRAMWASKCADLGKVLLHPTFGAEPQYAVVGKTLCIIHSWAV